MKFAISIVGLLAGVALAGCVTDGFFKFPAVGAIEAADEVAKEDVPNT